MKINQILVLCATLLLLSSCGGRNCIIFCHNQTGIQSGYVVARDDCQDLAQDVVAHSPNTRNRNEALLEAFAKCMKNEGWGVTSPKKTNSNPGGPNDNSQLAGNPWDPSPYGIRQPTAQPQAIQRQQPYPAQPQPYGYASQQGYGYGQPPVQQRIYQNYGYSNPQAGYNPYPQSAAPAAPQSYGYPQVAPPAPQQNYVPSYGGGYSQGGYFDPNVIAPNRAGIGIAPGFAN